MTLLLAFARNLGLIGLVALAFSLLLWLVRKPRWSNHPKGSAGLLTDLLLSNGPWLLAFAAGVAAEDGLGIKGVASTLAGFAFAVAVFYLSGRFGLWKRASDRADLTRALPRAGDVA